MVTTNEEILNRLQAGFEASPGVAATPTRKLYAVAAPTVDSPISWYNDTTGTYANRRRVTKGRTRASWRITDLATFEDLHWWFYLLVEGTPNESIGTDPSVLIHEFIPDLDTDTLRSATLEWGDPGNKYTSSQAYANSFTLRGNSDSDSEMGWMLETELIARTFAPLAAFTALTDRETEVITARGTQCFIDDDPVGIGTTEVETLINWSVSGAINRHTKAFSKDEFYVALGRTGRQGRTFDAQVTLEFEDDTEFEKYRSTTPVQRAIRLSRDGSEIATGENRNLTLDLLGYWSAVSFGNREGNKTITLSLQAGYDASEAYDAKFAITNDQAAIA